MKWMFQNQVMQKRRSASDIHIYIYINIYIYGHIITIRKASPGPQSPCLLLALGGIRRDANHQKHDPGFSHLRLCYGIYGKTPCFQVQKGLPENGWLGRLMDTIIDGCLYKVSLWMLMDVSLMMDGCPIFIVLAVASPSRHQHHQRQIEPTRCQLEDLTQDDYFNGENMRNHWIGLRGNLNRKPMGFYHQRQRAFRFQFSHHPILWRKWWLTNTYIWCDTQILTSGFWGTHGYPIFRPTQNTAGSFNNGLRNPEGTPCDSQKKIQIYMCYCQATRDSCGKVIKIPCHGNSNIVDVYKFECHVGILIIWVPSFGTNDLHPCLKACHNGFWRFPGVSKNIGCPPCWVDCQWGPCFSNDWSFAARPMLWVAGECVRFDAARLADVKVTGGCWSSTEGFSQFHNLLMQTCGAWEVQNVFFSICSLVKSRDLKNLASC